MINIFTVQAEEFVKRLIQLPEAFHGEYLYATTIYTVTPAVLFSQTIVADQILQCQTGMFGFADDCADRDVAYGVSLAALVQDLNFDSMTPSDMLNITYDETLDQVCVTMQDKSSAYFPCKKMDSVSKLLAKFVPENCHMEDSWQVLNETQQEEKETIIMSTKTETTTAEETTVQAPTVLDAPETTAETSAEKAKRARRSPEEIAQSKEREAIDFLLTRGFQVSKTVTQDATPMEAAASALEGMRVAGTAMKVALVRLEQEGTSLKTELETAKKSPAGEVLTAQEQAVINALRAAK